MKHNKEWIVWLLLLEKLIINSQFVNKTSKSSNWHSEATTTAVFYFHILRNIIPPKHLLQIQLAFMVPVCVRAASASCHPSSCMRLGGDWTNEGWRSSRVAIDCLRSRHRATVSHATHTVQWEAWAQCVLLKPMSNDFFFPSLPPRPFTSCLIFLSSFSPLFYLFSCVSHVPVCDDDWQTTVIPEELPI